MFQKKLRLKTKDVRFLTKKGIRWYGIFFSFHSFPQYPNISYNQISCHISIKYDKRAVHRNNIKRIILNYIQNKKLNTKQRNINGKYIHYKIFIGLNKQNIERFKEKIKNLEKKQQRKIIIQLLEKHFTDRENNIKKHREKKPLTYKTRKNNDQKHSNKKR